MHVIDVIAWKRDGHALSPEMIQAFVDGVHDGSIPDYQTSALLMAIVLRGMTAQETHALTTAMLRSGERLDLSGLPGVKVGKHSTGGVGDKVSIALAPLVAACGVVVPKMSGRGLGHTGGTVDKLESIPGYRTDLTIQEFRRVLADVGTSLIGQTGALAPVDKKLYALRDVTATVDSVPLIAASIMSKKLAEGTSALVLDVKCGRGAFMKSEADARALARMMVEIGGAAGVRTEALLSRMDVPLGAAIGNAVEIRECIGILRGDGPSDAVDVIVTLATRMVEIGRGFDAVRAAQEVRAAIASGAALDRLRALIARHGGDPEVVDQPERLPRAAHLIAVAAERSGYVRDLDAARLAQAAVLLGAGRESLNQPIDHAVGIVLDRSLADQVRAGQSVLHVHYNDASRLDEVLALARSAVAISDAPLPPRSPVIGWVTENE